MTLHTCDCAFETDGLDPACGRCAEHAEHPLSTLDYSNVRRLLEGRIYSELDRVAAERLREIAASADLFAPEHEEDRALDRYLDYLDRQGAI